MILYFLGSYLDILRLLWQNLSITPWEALVYMMLDARLSCHGVFLSVRSL